MINYELCQAFGITHNDIVNARQAVLDGEGITVVGLSLGLDSSYGAQEMASIINELNVLKEGA